MSLLFRSERQGGLGCRSVEVVPCLTSVGLDLLRSRTQDRLGQTTFVVLFKEPSKPPAGTRPDTETLSQELPKTVQVSPLPLCRSMSNLLVDFLPQTL